MASGIAKHARRFCLVMVTGSNANGVGSGNRRISMSLKCGAAGMHPSFGVKIARRSVDVAGLADRKPLPEADATAPPIVLELN